MCVDVHESNVKLLGTIMHVLQNGYQDVPVFVNHSRLHLGSRPLIMDIVGSNKGETRATGRAMALGRSKKTRVFGRFN